MPFSTDERVAPPDPSPRRRARHTLRRHLPRPRVVGRGGASAGSGAARNLGGADVDVVLVDRHDYHTFQPLLYQFATGLLETTRVGHSLRDLLSRHDNTATHQ